MSALQTGKGIWPPAGTPYTSGNQRQSFQIPALSFSNFRVHMNHPGIWLKCRLDAVAPGWGLEFCIFNS